jgi:hypothetical protein
MEANQINLCIMAGRDGGIAVYELLDGANQLVFAGNVEEFTAYTKKRGETLVEDNKKAPAKNEHVAISLPRVRIDRGKAIAPLYVDQTSEEDSEAAA